MTRVSLFLLQIFSDKKVIKVLLVRLEIGQNVDNVNRREVIVNWASIIQHSPSGITHCLCDLFERRGPPEVFEILRGRVLRE